MDNTYVTDEAKSPLDRGSRHYNDQLEAEIFRLKVRKDAQHKFNEDETTNLEIPTGILIDGELPPDPPELLPNLLLAAGCNGIIGQKEVGKSLVSLELQYSLVTGEPLWNFITPTRTIEKSVHIVGEHSSSILMGLYHRMGLAKTGRIKLFGPDHIGPFKLIMSNGSRREEAVSRYKKMVEGAGLVVFDPIASFVSGEGSENDNAQMRHLIDSLTEIANSTGAACLVLGHQGKPTYVDGKMMKKSLYATRGASSIEDALVSTFYLDKERGVTIDNKEVFMLRQIHYKGSQGGSFKLLRDKKTCRHTVVK